MTSWPYVLVNNYSLEAIFFIPLLFCSLFLDDVEKLVYKKSRTNQDILFGEKDLKEFSLLNPIKVHYYQKRSNEMQRRD